MLVMPNGHQVMQWTALVRTARAFAAAFGAPSEQQRAQLEQTSVALLPQDWAQAAAQIIHVDLPVENLMMFHP